MKTMRTIGREIYKDAVFEIYFTRDMSLLDGSDPEMYQLMYVDEGSVIVSESGGEKSLFAPVTLCINYARPISNVSLTGARGFSVFFRPQVINHGLLGMDAGEDSGGFRTERILIEPFLRGGMGNPFYLPVNGSIRNRMLRMADNLERQLTDQPDQNWPCRGRSFFLEMLMLLQSMFAFEDDSASSSLHGDNELYPIIREIHARYPDPALSVGALARAAGMNPLIAAWRFRRSTGSGVRSYLEKLRCSVGANLLKNTLLGVGEIARRCGYRDESRFASEFERREGLSPIPWRAQFPDPYA